MAADSVLVKGAYMAAGGHIENYGLAASVALSNIATTAANTVIPIVQERRARFEQFADSELTRNAGLNDEEFELLEKDLRRMRKSYIWGGKKDKQMLLREVDEQRNQLGELDATKKSFAESINSNDGMKNNSEFLASDMGQSLIESMQGAPIQQGNKLGYMITDNDGNERFMSSGDINRLIEEQSFDTVSQDVLSEYVSSQITESQNILPGENGEFNYEMNSTNVRNNIVNKGNLRSLVMDEHIPGRSFYTDTQEMLMNNTYGDLGISSDDFEDPTPKTPITQDDARKITNSLLQDDNITKDYLTMYYTNFAEQNWNMAAEAREDGGRSEFEKAFAFSREKLGPGQVFEYRGKPYSTNYTEEDENEFM